MSNPVKTSTINNSLNCKGCGALLHFVPGTHNLQCDYCGVANEIEASPNSNVIESVDYEGFITTINSDNNSAELKVVKCNGCGSQTILDEFVTAEKCPFCTAALVLESATGQQYVTPHYILPFAVTQQQAIGFFEKWLKGLWWAPNDLAKTANSNSATLKGVYIPHWTYDVDTLTSYSGERGDYYYTTETYTTTVDGKSQTQTRQVRHTRWSYASGRVFVPFKDLIVPASKSLPDKTLNQLGPWDFDMLVRFDERYVSGFRSETFQVSPQDGYVLAEAQTVAPINDTIRNDIGGDEQRIDNTDTEYNNKAIKYMMLPVWVSSYNYNNKIYQFTINASTGEVIGQRPISAIKIILAVLLVLAIIAAIVLYVNYSKAH